MGDYAGQPYTPGPLTPWVLRVDGAPARGQRQPPPPCPPVPCLCCAKGTEKASHEASGSEAERRPGAAELEPPPCSLQLGVSGTRGVVPSSHLLPPTNCWSEWCLLLGLRWAFIHVNRSLAPRRLGCSLWGTGQGCASGPTASSQRPETPPVDHLLSAAEVHVLPSGACGISFNRYRSGALISSFMSRRERLSQDEKVKLERLKPFLSFSRSDGFHAVPCQKLN